MEKKKKAEQLNTIPRPLRERESAEAEVLLHLGIKSQNAKHGIAVYRRRTRQRKQLYERSELQMQMRGYKQSNQEEPRPLNTTTRDLVKCSPPARKGWGQLARLYFGRSPNCHRNYWRNCCVTCYNNQFGY